MVYQKQTYLEHVALFVKNMKWHIRFFEEALGMGVVNVNGNKENPSQVWLQGGLQLINDSDFDGSQGGLGHIAIIAEDLEQALEEVYTWNVTELSKGRNWVELPEGHVLELIQAPEDSLEKLLNVEVSYR